MRGQVSVVVRARSGDGTGPRTARIRAGRARRAQAAAQRGRLPGMGLSAAVCVGIGVFLGVWADGAWHTSPLCLLIGLALGLVAAVSLIVTQIREYL
jgi:F0F1-type ATP synthase assembly protein I